MTKLMARAHTHMLMGLSTKGIGKMISNMVMVLRCGQMGLFMRDSTMREKRMDKEN